MSPSPFGGGDPTPSRVAQANREFYDRVALEFDATRRDAWPFVAEFLAALTRRDTPLLDLGCGNGRHTQAAALLGLRTVGVDLSGNLVRLARGRAGDALGGPQFVQGDAFRLPFRAASFPGALFLATLHHVPTRRLRGEMLREVLRVLAPGGRVLVSSWKYPHPDRHGGGAVARFQGKAPAGSGSMADAGGLFEEGDEMVPWRSGGGNGDAPARFVHFMTARELETALVEEGFAVESVRALQVASKLGPDNVVAVARKPS